MKVELTLEIPINEDICKSVIDSVEPDNVTAPPQIAIEMLCSGGILTVNVRGKDVNLLTFRNTVDDLIEHISLATKIVKPSVKG
jgi:tRNA threonylcarbamoyladenosine modification (KEOPS) complex  Pcc1 subunit|uniref:KEOPS complex subunit n=1 Tax=Ignisphaera aggregans TaxID=334771 RepID=A0A7J2U6R7_9CREN